MRCLYVIVFLCVLVGLITCPPVKKGPPKGDAKAESDDLPSDANLGLEYETYLKEVVSILEQDENFRRKLQEANITDIKSGDIAKHLDFVHHDIRTKLDELKRQEVERLRQLVRIQQHKEKGIQDSRIMLRHVDHINPHSFEIEDLAKLIKTATQDLENIDKQRKDDFKTYEMEKEHLRRQKLKEMDETQREQEMKKMEEMKNKHKEHPKVHHPGSEDQLEEVWEEKDGMDKNDFDPKTFFHLHDTNSDGLLDEQEIEALFQTELDKVYDPNAPEDDMRERYEEMNRMREHVFAEIDVDKNKLISLEEFIRSTKTEEYKKDEAWDTLDEQQQFEDGEFADFEKQFDQEHAQPGEVNIPPHHATFAPDHMGGGQPQPVEHMQQQQQQQQQQYQQQQDAQGPPAPAQHHQPPPQDNIPNAHHEQPPPRQVQHQEQPQQVHHQEQPQQVHHQEQPQQVQHQEQPQQVQHQEQPQQVQHQEQPQQVQHQEQPQQVQQQQFQQPPQHQQVQQPDQQQPQHHEQQQQQAQQPQHHEQQQQQQFQQPEQPHQAPEAQQQQHQQQEVPHPVDTQQAGQAHAQHAPGGANAQQAPEGANAQQAPEGANQQQPNVVPQ